MAGASGTVSTVLGRLGVFRLLGKERRFDDRLSALREAMIYSRGSRFGPQERRRDRSKHQGGVRST